MRARLFSTTVLLAGVWATSVLGQTTADLVPLDATPPFIRTPMTEIGTQGSSELLLTQGTTEPKPQGPAPAESGAGDGGASGGGNGTNPAEMQQTFLLRNEYLRLASGFVTNTTTAGLTFPAFQKRGSVAFQLPFNYLQPNVPNIGSLGGLGDVKAAVTYNAWSSENKKVTLVTGMDMWVPSADNVLLARDPNLGRITFQDIGTGKFRLGPFAALVFAVSKTAILAPLYQHEFSVAGDSARPDIHRGVFKLFGMKAFANGVYVLGEAQILIDYQNRGDLDVYLSPEVGYSMKGGTTLFAKTGFGINPDPNNRQFAVSFGIRQNY